MSAAAAPVIGAEATSTPQSYSDALDSVFAPIEVSIPDTPSEETTAASSETEPAPAETKPPESETTVAESETKPAESATKPDESTEEPSEEPFAEMKPDGEARNGKDFILRRRKFERLMEAGKFQEAVQSAMPGATPDQVKAAFEDQISGNRMLADWDSGDPKRVDVVASTFLKDANPASVQRMFERMGQALPQEAVKQYQEGIVKSYAESLYRKAAAEQDASKAEQLELLAGHLEFALTGKHRTRADFQQRDPREVENETLRREIATLRQQVPQQPTPHQQWKSDTDQALDTAIDDVVKQVLSPVESAMKEDSDLADLTNLRVKEAISSAMSGNPLWVNNFRLELERAARNPTEQSRVALSKMMQDFIRPHIARAAKGILDKHSQRVLQTNAATHQEAASAAQRKEANGTAATGKPASRIEQMREAAKTGGYNAAVEALFSDV